MPNLELFLSYRNLVQKTQFWFRKFEKSPRHSLGLALLGQCDIYFAINMQYINYTASFNGFQLKMLRRGGIEGAQLTIEAIVSVGFYPSCLETVNIINALRQQKISATFL